MAFSAPKGWIHLKDQQESKGRHERIIIRFEATRLIDVLEAWSQSDGWSQAGFVVDLVTSFPVQPGFVAGSNGRIDAHTKDVIISSREQALVLGASGPEVLKFVEVARTPAVASEQAHPLLPLFLFRKDHLYFHEKCS